MKIVKMVSLDMTLTHKLSQVENVSGLINTLLHEYFDKIEAEKPENVDELHEKMSKIAQKIKEIKQNMAKNRQKSRENAKKEAEKRENLRKMALFRMQNTEKWQEYLQKNPSRRPFLTYEAYMRGER